MRWEWEPSPGRRPATPIRPTESRPTSGAYKWVLSAGAREEVGSGHHSPARLVGSHTEHIEAVRRPRHDGRRGVEHAAEGFPAARKRGGSPDSRLGA